MRISDVLDQEPSYMTELKRLGEEGRRMLLSGAVAPTNRAQFDALVNGRGIMLYKCRICGEVGHSDARVPSMRKAINDALDEDREEIDYSVIHRCKDGRIGMMDICGAHPDPELI